MSKADQPPLRMTGFVLAVGIGLLALVPLARWTPHPIPAKKVSSTNAAAQHRSPKEYVELQFDGDHRTLDANLAPVANLAPLPGGDLPIDSGAVSTTAGTAIRAQDEEQLSNGRMHEHGTKADSVPRTLQSDPRRARLMPEARYNPLRPATAGALAAPVRVASALAADDPRVGLDEAATVRLMRQLHDGSDAVVRRAEAELRKQGFTDAHLQLARRMTDDNASVRRELVEALPGMPSIDAKVWLIWLSRDEDTEVRLAAISVMATTGDPELLKRVEQIARQDRDPRIQKQGERLGKSP